MEERNLWFNQNISDVSKKLDVDIEKGLTAEKAKERVNQYGYNELEEKKKKTLVQKFIDQFKDFMIIVLLFAAGISGVIGYIEGEGIVDTLIILLVVLVNAIIGVAQESKAEASLEALKKMSGYVAKVLRNGNVDTIPTKELVPGDIVYFETGDMIPADGRLINSSNLKVREDMLTGESNDVVKYANKIFNSSSCI
jgi:Ca2+-transporting ATPase